MSQGSPWLIGWNVGSACRRIDRSRPTPPNSVTGGRERPYDPCRDSLDGPPIPPVLVWGFRDSWVSLGGRSNPDPQWVAGSVGPGPGPPRQPSPKELRAPGLRREEQPGRPRARPRPGAVGRRRRRRVGGGAMRRLDRRGRPVPSPPWRCSQDTDPSLPLQSPVTAILASPRPLLGLAWFPLDGSTPPALPSYCPRVVRIPTPQEHPSPMALFNPILGSLRGKLGGNVFSRNRNGAYVRVKVSPVNPDTTRQNTARAVLALFSDQWSSTLTQAQRDTWIAYAAGTPLVNQFGNTYFMTGAQAYIRTNAHRVNNGAPEVTGASGFNGEGVTPDLSPVGAVVVHNAVSTIPNVVTVDPALVTGYFPENQDSTLAIWASFTQIVGVRFPPSHLLKVGSFLGDVALPPPAASFPLPSPSPINTIVFVYARQGDFFGRISPMFTLRTLSVTVV